MKQDILLIFFLFLGGAGWGGGGFLHHKSPPLAIVRVAGSERLGWPVTNDRGSWRLQGGTVAAAGRGGRV